MSDEPGKKITRLDLLARGPSELTDMLAEGLAGYCQKAIERANGSEEAQAKGSTAVALCTMIVGSFAEAVVVRKTLEGEKLKAEALKLLEEVRKTEVEGRKLISDEEVNKATVKKLESEAVNNRAQAMKTLGEALEKFGDPALASLAVRYVLSAGEADGNFAISLGGEARAIGQPMGDKATARGNEKSED